jgi:hypothetical protein
MSVGTIYRFDDFYLFKRAPSILLIFTIPIFLIFVGVTEGISYLF